MKQYKYKINGAQYDVTIDSIAGNIAKVEVNGIPFEVEMQGSSLVEEALPVQVADEASVTATPAQAAPKAETPAPAAAAGPGTGAPVKAPLPGVVTKVPVTVGQTVKKGETVLVLEAMKMENNINADKDGKITAVNVSKGESVLEGTDLVIIE